MTIDIGSCIAQDFAPHVGTAFGYEHSSGQALEFRLLRIRDTPEFKAHALWARRPPFSLYFAAPEGFEVGQGTFTLQHRDLGKMMVFMVPIGRVGGSDHDLSKPLLMQCAFS